MILLFLTMHILYLNTFSKIIILSFIVPINIKHSAGLILNPLLHKMKSILQTSTLFFIDHGP
jgi:hypothetical protein